MISEQRLELAQKIAKELSQITKKDSLSNSFLKCQYSLLRIRAKDTACPKYQKKEDKIKFKHD